MTDLDLDAIRQRVEAAKKVRHYEDRGLAHREGGEAWSVLYEHAPTDIPALLAEVERLRGEVAELKTSLTELQPSSAVARAERAERVAESTKRAHDALAATVERVRVAVSNHPGPCEIRPEDDAVSCGWKIAYADVVAAIQAQVTQMPATEDDGTDAA